MKYFLIFITAILFSFFQTTIWSFNFLLLFVLSIGLVWPADQSLFWAFFAGLMFSLFVGGPLGYPSLGFVLALSLIVIIRQRFSLHHPLFCFAVSFFAYLLFSLITGWSIRIFESLFLAALVAIFHFWQRPVLGVKK